MPKYNYIIRSKDISISTNKVQEKYYDPETKQIDISKMKKDILRLNTEIDQIVKDGLYTLDSPRRVFKKVYPEFEDDYLFLLTTRRDALLRYIRDQEHKDVVIPDYIKKKYTKEEK